MGKDYAQLRKEAWECVRDAKVAWAAVKESGIAPRGVVQRFLRRAGQAETALLRVIREDVDDPGPRMAYAEVVSLRSRAAAALAEQLGRFTGRLSADASIAAARAALWASDRDGLGDLEPDHIASLVEEPPMETEFGGEQLVKETLLLHGSQAVVQETRLLLGETRVAAADARFALAERLSCLPSRPPKDAVTPQAIDATLRGSKKFRRTDEVLVWSCQLRSCLGLEPADEARILAMEGVYLYIVLAALVGSRFGQEDVERAEERCDAVLGRISGDSG